MVLLCSAHQDASNDIHFDLEVTLRPRDLRSPLDFDLMWSWYTYFDAYQREDLDGIVSFALAQLVQKLSTKNSLVLKCRHFDFFTPGPVTSFLTWSKNDLSKNCRDRPSVSNAVYRLSLACFVFEISGGEGRLSAPSVSTQVAQTLVGARVNLGSDNFQSGENSGALLILKLGVSTSHRSNSPGGRITSPWPAALWKGPHMMSNS